MTQRIKMENSHQVLRIVRSQRSEKTHLVSVESCTSVIVAVIEKIIKCDVNSTRGKSLSREEIYEEMRSNTSLMKQHTASESRKEFSGRIALGLVDPLWGDIRKMLGYQR